MSLSTFFYNTGIGIYRAAAGFAAGVGGNKKAQLWLNGRKDPWPALEAAFKGNERVLWVHAASLGEFEQGRPVLEAIRKEYPGLRILLTFFSPSGYEVRKDYPGADYVCYLPLDTPRNARRFLDIVKPSLAIFIKYEFWYHYLSGMYTRKIPVILISGIFRHNQVFFKRYGGMFRKLLERMDHLFVQNDASLHLLHIHGINQVTVVGDTRFDRVWQLRQHPVSLPDIERFITVENTVVAGSTWEADEKVLAEWWYGGGREGRQLVVAPHEIHDAHIENIKALFPDAVKYSEFAASEAGPAAVMIIDNVGMLSALYRYGRIAYVGGGFGKEGIHNLLEPATYSRPVIIGPVFHQFLEAETLVQTRGAIVINNAAELGRAVEALKDPYYYEQTAEITGRFVQENQGATDKIMHYIQEKRFLTKV
ncbi:3-deoxy-D-manno-octulosonic acid transferase [Chitinophaga barathri]|uniref:3-deoxy-D-manno-octulosonic acid transferase n=1 Tax=Chitinophaga barathri TaxID=1647451 RepID=UPI0013C4EA6C|nr:glycosyltransferase N-terminal domain-containing protein [Chitinophaga barathri]